ncbi:uncharacterized protein J7T54_000007 [Emericellopsis cladophorae]|uniref:Uncharacterized protein n=1 Tax=Emericellopsis cladophorae TaxID=2686198 RepID=A0A9P9XUU4_9HYPO|nr:uncharacterized protein J7T54_000007 [Emericellopsis cladophorae]KAI6778198.1 hypothetical protein J7T54_000007 [Emericellopsis cladophorae]
MAHEAERQREPHHQRHHPGGSYPPPLFVAELDGGIPHASPDGAPVFEMPAEPSPNSQVDSHSQPKKFERQNSDTPAQANPWAYFGPNDDSSSVVTPTPTNRPPAERHDSASNSAAATATKTEHDGRQGHAGYGPETMAPTMTGESSVSATDYPSNLRPETVSPVSPSAGSSAYFPPPLTINKPAQPQPQSPPLQGTTSWKYKPYKPYSPEMDNRDASQPSRYQDTSSTFMTGAMTANVAYRPYRRPSFKEPPQEEQRYPGPSSGHTSPRPQHEALVGSLAAQPYPEGMAPHHSESGAWRCTFSRSISSSVTAANGQCLVASSARRSAACAFSLTSSILSENSCRCLPAISVADIPKSRRRLSRSQLCTFAAAAAIFTVAICPERR